LKSDLKKEESHEFRKPLFLVAFFPKTKWKEKPRNVIGANNRVWVTFAKNVFQRKEHAFQEECTNKKNGN
jgi:hypothetical protein